MIPVFTRIALRYLAAVLVTRGLIGSDDAAALSADPDVQMMIEMGAGALIAAATEAWHWFTLKIEER